MADESIFNGGDGPPPEGGRRRLQLKPRSAEGVAAANAQRSTKSNPFGAARPREEILKAKGVDVGAMEAKLDAKTAKLPRMNKEQQEEYDSLSDALKFEQSEIEKADTPEAKAAADEKVKAAQTALDEWVAALRATEKKSYERPSERRARAEGRDGDGGGGDAESYSSFGGRSGGGGGYGGGRESNDAKLYVGNLNFDTTEVRLLVLFSFAFVCAGKLMKLLHFCCSTEYCP